MARIVGCWIVDEIEYFEVYKKCKTGNRTIRWQTNSRSVNSRTGQLA